MTTKFNHAHPSSVMVYASQRQQARIAVGARAGVPGSQPVYLVVLRGHFIGPSPPAGGDAGRLEANVITMILDRTTLRQFYYGFGSHVDTNNVGPGLRLTLG
jgi:hypothetical protein